MAGWQLSVVTTRQWGQGTSITEQQTQGIHSRTSIDQQVNLYTYRTSYRPSYPTLTDLGRGTRINTEQSSPKEDTYRTSTFHYTHASTSLHTRNLLSIADFKSLGLQLGISLQAHVTRTPTFQSVLSVNIQKIEMTDRSLGLSGGIGSLASDPSTKKFGSSARPVFASEKYADYGFIAMLGLAQRLHVRFLPITWQAPLGPIGKGGQAGINESLVTAQISFAFKLFNRPQQHPFREIVQEMVVLSHPTVRQHRHIVTLEGICWDIPEDNQVWPVLVFEKSHLGDLHRFARLESFKDLSIEDKLNLCADVGLAIRDMHRNGNIFCEQVE